MLFHLSRVEYHYLEITKFVFWTWFWSAEPGIPHADLFEAVLVGLRHLGVEDEELEMRHADPVHAVVPDVRGPRAALDVQQLAHGRVLESHGNQGRLVVLLNPTRG